jgi:hypothetical protein
VIPLRLLILVAFCWPGLADDVQLDALRSSLSGMRVKQPESGGSRGATPQLTVAKHQLRNWVESRLTALTQRGDEGELERKLNSELREAKLSCGYRHPLEQQPCPDWTFSGFLGDLKIRRHEGFLVVQTALGIECGFDESAYLYSWSGEGWKRVWQTEQNTYTEKEYHPQTLHSVLISPYNKANEYMVLTLGSESWCSSNWHTVYYRMFRLGPDPQAGPLLEGSEFAYLAHYRPVQGGVGLDDVLVEFTIGSIDGGVLTREAVRHYKIDHGEVRRVDPLALSPRDFVDEWLTHDWKETAHWSESVNRRSMLEWHGKLHKDFVSGDFIYPTKHCLKTPDLWQVGIDFSDPPTPVDSEPKGTYFLVRWRPPYQFTMVQVSNRPSPECTEEDRKADDEPRTLFPVQEWR